MILYCGVRAIHQLGGSAVDFDLKWAGQRGRLSFMPRTQSPTCQLTAVWLARRTWWPC